MAELEAEVGVLRPTVDALLEYVRAQGESRVERVLDTPERVHVAVERGVHRGAAVALIAAQVQMGHDLRHAVGFPKGLNATHFEEVIDQFDDAAKAVLAEMPAEEVLHEAH